MLPGGERSPGPIQVTGDLVNGLLHQFRSERLIGEQNLRSLTGLFPNLMTGQSHVGPNRPSCAIRVPVPPSEHFPCTRHHCTIDRFTTKRDRDERVKITSGPDGSVSFEDDLRLLRNRFTCQKERLCNARTRDHDTSGFDSRTLLGRAFGGGRETVQNAGRERCL